ncbi:Dehydrogenase [Cladobotryum mycophilum]|uniref:Dehydrogenase n=1 Tax=Cladobotryum mycophilum TaxID=491253 RepID=A0ABR0SJL9_9HYPO
MTSHSYDYIIVGGGTAGLVLAARLTEDATIRVLVLEAGEDQTSDPRTSVPAMWPELFNECGVKLRTVPQLVFAQPLILGGCSAINALAFTLTSKASVDAWAKLGNPGWEFESFSKSFSNAYTLTSSSGVEAVGNGPLQLSYPPESNSPWPNIWKESLENLGYPSHGDPYSGLAYGVMTNADSINHTSKTRSYSANAYLEPIRDRENLILITQALVEKVLFIKDDRGRVMAEGVQYTKDGETKKVAAKDVILTAGAINTPKILELSGVGDANLLEKLGIDVVIDNPNVGENLQNHPFTGLSFEVGDDEWTMDAILRRNPGAIGEAREAYGKQAGPFASSGINNVAQLPLPGIQTAAGRHDAEKLIEEHITNSHIDPVTKATAAFAEAHGRFVQSVLRSPEEASAVYISFPGFSSYTSFGVREPPPAGTDKYFTVNLLLSHPLSRGSVHITSATPSSPELAIDPRHLTHPLDMEVLARHVCFVESIMATEPMAGHIKQGGKRNPAAPPPGALSSPVPGEYSTTALEQAKDYLRRTVIGGNHFTGTCAMMRREIGGVVDPQLRVYGCDNLRVCDASIIPITPRANSQAAVYGVAEHAAIIIKSSK